MENVELVENRGVTDEPRHGRPSRLERTLRDLVPVTLAAGAAAVAVAVAVGGSTSRLPTPFARGAGSGGAATSVPADPAVTDSGNVTVRLGPKANRTQPAAAVGLGPDLVVAPLTRAGGAPRPAAVPLIFAPTGLGVAAPGPDAAAPPVGPLVVPEAVLAPPVPAEVTVPEAVVVFVAPALQEAQAVARPRPLKTLKDGRRQADADPAPEMAQAASLGSVTSPTKTSTVAAAEPAREQGNGAVNGQGQGPEQPTGNDKDKAKDKDKKGKDDRSDESPPPKGRQAS